MRSLRFKYSRPKTHTVLPVQAYGPDGLGLLTVAGVPGFVELRQRLLPLAQAFAVSLLSACATPCRTCKHAMQCPQLAI